MNYLAHLALSFPFEGLVVGNFIGDHVRNKDLINLPIAIRQGVEMHRSIDSFTDTNQNSIAIRHKLFEEYRHVSRILVDMYYDHFLAVHFEQFHEVALPKFTKTVQGILRQQTEHMPPTAQRYLAGMQAENWLLKYKTLEGIQDVLEKMAKRSGLQLLNKGIHTLTLNYAFVERQFLCFYPKLLLHCDSFKKEE